MTGIRIIFREGWGRRYVLSSVPHHLRQLCTDTTSNTAVLIGKGSTEKNKSAEHPLKKHLCSLNHTYNSSLVFTDSLGIFYFMYVDIIATSHHKVEVFCKISAKFKLSASTIPPPGDILTENLIAEYIGVTFYQIWRASWRHTDRWLILGSFHCHSSSDLF